GFVPQPNHRKRAAVFIAESTQAGGAEEKIFAGQRLKTEPAGGEHSQEMPAGKKQHIAVNRAHSIDHVIGPGSDFGRRLTARTAVAKEHPIRPLLVNFRGTATLILAVVPFEQTAIHFCLSGESGELASMSRALERAGEYADKRQSL